MHNNVRLCEMPAQAYGGHMFVYAHMSHVNNRKETKIGTRDGS